MERDSSGILPEVGVWLCNTVAAGHKSKSTQETGHDEGAEYVFRQQVVIESLSLC